MKNNAGYLRVMIHYKNHYSPYYRYFDANVRNTALLSILGVATVDTKEIAVVDNTDPDRKFNQELRKGYYDADKAAKYFGYGRKKQIAESANKSRKVARAKH